jgi:hypothetical protein
MSGRTDSARTALRRVQYLHPSMHEDIIKELDREGILDEPRSDGGAVRAVAAAALPERGECLTAIQAVAANPNRNAARVKRVLAESARLGFQIDPTSKIDLFAMDKALQGRDVAARMNLKLNLAFLRMID